MKVWRIIGGMVYGLESIRLNVPFVRVIDYKKDNE